jgi:hypothetical protein
MQARLPLALPWPLSDRKTGNLINLQLPPMQVGALSMDCPAQ